MTDNTEAPQKTPLSSSSSNPSGTQALSVSIDEDVQQEQVAGKEEAAPTGESASDERADTPTADNENTPGYGRTEHAGAGADLSDSADIEDSSPLSGSAEDEPPADDNFPELTPEQDMAEDTVPEPERSADTADLEVAASGVPESEPAEAASEAGEALPMADTDNPVEPEIAADEAPSEAYDPDQSDIRVQTNGLMTGEPTTEELREAVRNTLAERSAEHEKAFALFNQMSHDLRAAMEDARDDAARVSFKLMEFAQASFHNNVELARDCTTAKSVPDLFNVQSSYIQRQLELLNSKTRELHALTNEIASKKAEKLQNRLKSD
ncbi:MAG: phasin family protein [Rhodomicrobiaceae bacterium]